MRIALMSDIHSNREAFSACLAHAREHGAERYVFLGDYVGYGADPNWVVETLVDLAGKGAIAIAGNHDRAIGSERHGMNSLAGSAIEWTTAALSRPAIDFLAGLPLFVEEEDRLYVHADASQPEKWIYVDETASAATSLAATHQRVTFCGHVHVPMLYGITATQKLLNFQPVAESPIPLLRQRRWLVVVGSVGQPRDRIAAAAYALYDTLTCNFTALRVPYDVDLAAAKIRKAGLPEALATRLTLGR
ncbi:MAG: metallophosphoesterase [Alphaproteobacteria bacterium]|nr:metallophosphoesterase [Alphaproteobacteria bacterium]